MKARNEMINAFSPGSYPVRAPIPTKGSMTYWTTNPTMEATTTILIILGLAFIPNLFTDASSESLGAVVDFCAFGGDDVRGLPHALQKLFPSSFACPQEAQNNCDAISPEIFNRAKRARPSWAASF
jgi:hypothetical protein